MSLAAETAWRIPLSGPLFEGRCVSVGWPESDPAAARKTRPFLMLTFAGGGRMCLGMRLAQIEFKAIIARVVTALELAPCTAEDIAHSGFWTARPAAPLRVRTRARQAPR